MEDKEHIESFIRKSLDQLEVQPAIPSFELTMKKLEAAQKEKRKKRFFFWFFAGLAVMGVSALAVFYPHSKTNDRLEIAAVKKETQQQVQNRMTQAGNKANPSSNENINTTTSAGKTIETHEAIQPQSTTSPTVASDKNTMLSAVNAATIRANPTLIMDDPSPIAYPEESAYPFMELHKTNDLDSTNNADTLLRNAVLLPDALSTKDSLKENKKDLVWYIGPGFSTQWTKYSFHKTKAGDNYAPFSDNYYATRLNETKPEWNYQASLQSGFVYKNKWMLLFGLGYSIYSYNETIRVANSNSPTSPSQPPTVVTFTNTGSSPGIMGPSSGSGMAFSTVVANESYTVKNIFRYATCSLAGSRVFMCQSLGLYTGVGFSTSRLLPSNVLTVEGENMYMYRYRGTDGPVSKWTFTPNVHIGVMKQLGGKILLQAGPRAFYNLNSMFSKSYIISQKPYGLGLDLNILIRLN
jgi:hypothetical protein